MTNLTRLVTTTLFTTFALGGLALAGDPKAPAPTPPAKDAKAPMPAKEPPPAAAPAMPEPSKELDAYMKPFDGTWKCDAKLAAGAMGPAEVTAKATVKFKKEANGFFWRGVYTMPKQKGVPMAFGAEFFISYDATSKGINFVGIDSLGNPEFEQGKIDGASATLTGESSMNGAKVKVRETMWTKDKTAGHKMEVDTGKGFQLMGTDDCKR